MDGDAPALEESLGSEQGTEVDRAHHFQILPAIHPLHSLDRRRKEMSRSGLRGRDRRAR